MTIDPGSPAASQPVTKSAYQPVSLSACQPVSLSACQPVSLSACQPVSLSACQPVSLSACQPVSLSEFNPKQQMQMIKSLQIDINVKVVQRSSVKHRHAQRSKWICSVANGDGTYEPNRPPTKMQTGAHTSRVATETRPSTPKVRGKLALAYTNCNFSIFVYDPHSEPKVKCKIYTRTSLNTLISLCR